MPSLCWVFSVPEAAVWNLAALGSARVMLLHGTMELQLPPSWCRATARIFVRLCFRWECVEGTFKTTGTITQNSTHNAPHTTHHTTPHTHSLTISLSWDVCTCYTISQNAHGRRREFLPSLNRTSRITWTWVFFLTPIEIIRPGVLASGAFSLRDVGQSRP